MSFDSSFYPKLLTFAAVGFTLFLSSSTARYTIYKEMIEDKMGKMNALFRIFFHIIGLLMIPGFMLITSPILILACLECEDLIYGSWGLHLIYGSYILAVALIPAGVVGYLVYCWLEKSIIKNYRKKLEEKQIEDFEAAKPKITSPDSLTPAT